MGREIVANMVCLGVLAGLVKIVDKHLFEEAIHERVPQGTAGFNIEAFLRGYALIDSGTRR